MTETPVDPVVANADREGVVPSDGGLTVADIRSSRRLTDQLTAEFLEHHALLPAALADGDVHVATWKTDPDPQAVDDLELLFAMPVQLWQLPEAEVRAAIRRLYSPELLEDGRPTSMDADAVTITRDADPALDDLVSLANEAPIVKIVNLVLLEALEARASDVHVESQGEGLRVRYRIDGLLQDVRTPPPHLAAGIVSRLKIMAELDIAERRVPQDGRIRLRMHDRQVDVRVSTLPSLHGESVVLRLLDKERGRIGLEDIGMAPDTLAAFAGAIARPHGIVLATGPTGSGKTTTLYAAIERIRTGREKILTVEDPVEYELSGVTQVQVNEKVGLTFAGALRALLRQDPDIMLVGEIRDHETAEIATHAALTGHLVLSTLHTNDAVSALTRLSDLGIAPFLVASTVEAILAQRLVRRICEACSEPAELSAEEAAALGEADGTGVAEALRDGVEPGTATGEWSGFQRGRGCLRCRDTGYHGRTGIYELLILDDEIRSRLPSRPMAADLQRHAVDGGMRTLRGDGLRLARAGTTTVSEVMRVTRGS
ncbi:MAG: GspE/PulE family protein [Gemmatimonadetes bacterium]|nr:GspE/PulE family protein [Gemmatimonadota bacterium]